MRIFSSFSIFVSFIFFDDLFFFVFMFELLIVFWFLNAWFWHDSTHVWIFHHAIKFVKIEIQKTKKKESQRNDIQNEWFYYYMKFHVNLIYCENKNRNFFFNCDTFFFRDVMNFVFFFLILIVFLLILIFFFGCICAFLRFQFQLMFEFDFYTFDRFFRRMKYLIQSLLNKQNRWRRRFRRNDNHKNKKRWQKWKIFIIIVWNDVKIEKKKEKIHNYKNFEIDFKQKRWCRKIMIIFFEFFVFRRLFWIRFVLHKIFVFENDWKFFRIFFVCESKIYLIEFVNVDDYRFFLV